MALFNWRKPRKIQTDSLIYAPSVNTKKPGIMEALKGLVQVNKVRFPAELGEEHPFDYSIPERLAKKFGIVSAIVDKYIDFIFSGDINVKSEDERAQTIIEEWMRDVQFNIVARSWIREGLLKGPGYLELGTNDDGTIDEVKTLKSDHMFVDRNEFGVVEGYNQFLKPMRMFTSNSKEITRFKPKEVAMLKFNIYGDDAYGLGIVFPLISILDDLISSRKNMHLIMERKSNNPLIFKMGNREKDQFPATEEMEALGQKLEWLTNKHEWVISDFVQPMTLDFGSLADKFEFIIENDLETLFMAAQIPSVVMGKAKVPEGLAEVQMRALQLRVQSMREDIEKVVEENIFKVVLNSQGIDAHVEIVWGLPTEKEKNEKTKLIIEAIKNPFLNENLRIGLQEKLAELMDIDPEVVEEPEDEREREEEEESQPIVPAQRKKTPTINPTGPKSAVISESIPDPDQTRVQEWVNFNYSTFQDDIIEAVKLDNFDNLHGFTKIDFKAGLLNSAQIAQVKTTLIEGFEQNKTIKDISKDLNKRVKFKDRLRMKDGRLVLNKKGSPILSLAAANRPIAVSRTETTRLSNLGAVNNYKKGGVEKIRWIAAMSERTCPVCEGLNGQIFPIDTSVIPPAHGMCRCTTTPVIK